MPNQTTRHKPYRGRFGQLVTNPEACEAHAMVVQLRRLTTLAIKAGRQDDVPVADLARASKMTAERVVEVVRRYDSWLLGLVENEGPIETWGVFEDGE